MLLSSRFASLFDMVVKLQGHEVAYSYGYLANAQGVSGNEPIGRSISEDQKVTLLEALDFVEQTCQKLELPVTMAQLPRVREQVKDSTAYIDSQQAITELRMRMHDELKARLFLFVPPIEARFFGVKEAFGERVARRFPRSITDIESAGDCIAVGMSTAAVFHLMRVMERGAQALGKRLSVQLVGEKNWQNILDEVNKGIKALPDNTSPKKKKKADYAAIAANLFNVKLAWRNPVMHPKESYSPEEAVEIYSTCKRFMEHLAVTL